MLREWRQRVEDVLDAITRVQSFTLGHDAASFAAERKVLDAVAYNVLVIGEAAARMPDAVVAAHPEIPWGKMRGIRNVVTHQYFEVRPEILWRTATEDLPSLVGMPRKLLDSDPSP